MEGKKQVRMDNKKISSVCFRQRHRTDLWFDVFGVLPFVVKPKRSPPFERLLDTFDSSGGWVPFGRTKISIGKSQNPQSAFWHSAPDAGCTRDRTLTIQNAPKYAVIWLSQPCILGNRFLSNMIEAFCIRIRTSHIFSSSVTSLYEKLLEQQQ